MVFFQMEFMYSYNNGKLVKTYFQFIEIFTHDSFRMNCPPISMVLSIEQIVILTRNVVLITN